MDYQGKLDSTGWPTGLPDAEKDELTRLVRDQIEKFGPQELRVLVRRVDNAIGAALPVYGAWSLQDARFAAIERACNALNMDPIWALHERDSGADEEAKRIHDNAKDDWGPKAWKKLGHARRVELIEIEIMGAVRQHRYVSKSGWFLVNVTTEATRLATIYGEPKVAS